MALRVSISAGLLAWLLQGVEIAGILDVLSHSAPVPLIAGILLQIATRLAAAERTFSITQALRLSLSRWQTTRTLFITNFYSFFMPDALAGGLGTVYQYSRYGVPWEQGTGALLVSRLIEFSVFCIATACALLADPQSPAGSGARTAIAMIFPFVVVIAFVGFRKSWWTSRPQIPLPHSRDMRISTRLQVAKNIVLGLGGRTALRGSVPALVQVLLGASGFVAFGAAMEIGFSLVTAVWVMGVVYVATLIPWSIAGIGIREFTLVQILAPLGVASSEALVLALLLLASQLLCGVVGAIFNLRS